MRLNVIFSNHNHFLGKYTLHFHDLYTPKEGSFPLLDDSIIHLFQQSRLALLVNLQVGILR